jgi:HSP20 family protein
MFYVPLHAAHRPFSGVAARPALRPWNRVLDDALASLLASTATGESEATRTPALDVAETDTAYTVTMEVPGVKKSDLKVTVEDRRVSIKAISSEGAEVAAAATAATLGNGENVAADAAADAATQATAAHERGPRRAPNRVLHRERTAARYERSFTLPAEVDAALASAKLEDGVLVLELPKRSAAVASQLTIN